MAVAIAPEDPRQPDVAALVAALDAYLSGLYPIESNHLLSIEALTAPDILFLVARLDDRPVGCGALRLWSAEMAELKRMYVDPSARGQGVGRRLLAALEQEAAARGIPTLCLETGIHQPEANALYRAAGYRERGPFGGYHLDRLSLFMEKALA